MRLVQQQGRQQQQMISALSSQRYCRIVVHWGIAVGGVAAGNLGNNLVGLAD